MRCQTFGTYGTFYDGYQSTDADDVTTGRWNDGASWNGWGGRVFNGRFHMNSLTNKLYDNTPRFNSLVTVAKGNGQNNYGIGHNNNNYNFGVWGYGSGGTPTVTELDQIFTDRYISNVDQIKLNVDRTDAISLRDDASIPAGDKIQLPASGRDEGYGPYEYRPTLYFDGPNAYYHYNDGGTYRVNTYGPAAGAGQSIDGKVFLSTTNNLNVYSTPNGVTGRVTVATTTGKSIVPVGNLVTSDYDFATGTVPSNSDNMIGLISGGYIAFNKTWTKRFAGAGADSTKYVSEQVTGGGAPGPGDGVGTLHMTAAIMAVEQFDDILPNGSWQGAKTSTYSMTGCEWWDGMWMQQSASGGFTDINNHYEDYGFQLYGNHILGGYSRTVWPGSSNRGCGGALVYTHDPRMFQRYLQPPGFPGVRNVENLLVLRIKNWSEENVY